MYFDRKTTVSLRQHVASLRPLMNAFYVSGALILLRSIYRAVGKRGQQQHLIPSLIFF
jgi:hypothetical protein